MQRSEAINELATALARAQGQMKAAIKDSSNPFFKSKYADLSSVVEAVKKPLSDNGLSYTQLTDMEEGAVVIETLLLHSSGQWLMGRLRMPVAKPNDPQALGSAITYCRRYALQSLCGVPADDDDANSATGKPGIHRPTDGAVDNLTEQERRKVQGIAEEMRELVMSESYEKAAAVFDKAAFHADEAVYCWTFFDAPTRSKLKRAAKVPAQAAA